jgi:N utilization substance protein B
MKRRLAREKAVQVLYQIDMRGIDSKEAMKAVLNEAVEAQDLNFLETIVDGVLKYKVQIDSSITKYLRGWTLNRLALVDRAILRIAVFEICYVETIPAKVTLNEALELARAFGMEESVKFINGVLDKVIKEKTGQESDADPTQVNEMNTTSKEEDSFL